MNVIDPERELIRRAARERVGSNVPAGRERPMANAIKLGRAEESPRVAEDGEAVAERSKFWYVTLNPLNAYQAWLVDQISVASLQVERAGRIERRLRDRSAARAEVSWDADRRLDAEELGLGLSRRPSAVSRMLRRTLQGCEWLADRWAMLARSADSGGAWDDPQRALAFDLLGVPPEARGNAKLGQDLGAEGTPVGPEIAPGEVARREIAGLRELMGKLAESDAIDQSLAEADLAEPTTPEYRRVRKLHETLYSRLRWLIRQVQFDSPRYGPSPHLKPYFEPPPPPGPDAEPEAAPATVAPEKSEATPDVSGECARPSFPVEPLDPRGVEARLRRAEVRRDARERKRIRRRA